MLSSMYCIISFPTSWGLEGFACDPPFPFLPQWDELTISLPIQIAKAVPIRERLNSCSVTPKKYDLFVLGSYESVTRPAVIRAPK